MKYVICKSGVKGWQCKLQINYVEFEEWKAYCENYNLHKKLGYKTPEAAWEDNPVIRGSVNPSDFCKVKMSLLF